MSSNNGKGHPYFPRTLEIPHYVPNDKGIAELLGVFFAVIAVAMVVLWVYMGKMSRLKNKTMTKMKICWFLSCGFIHLILEGYFSLFHKTLAGEQTLLAQMWKEYGRGDSRYITSDTFTVCMETITAFVDGPLAFLAVFVFLTNKPYRHLVQVCLSLCQLYGDVLYFMTEIREGFSHGEMYHPIYFWFYFFFMNILWIIIPSLCIVESYKQLTRCQALADAKVTPSGKKRR